MAQINFESIQIKVAQDSSGKLKAAAQNRAQQVFEDAVQGMQIEFDNHPVTQEIEAGIGASNISETLRGSVGPENLTSFIGFEDGDQPIEKLRPLLDSSTRGGPKMTYAGKEGKTSTTYNFKVTAPNQDLVAKATPMPWARGLSWAEGIEIGIPGFSHFLPSYKRNNSRSGGGIQVKPELRSAEFNKVPYLTEIFNNFLARVKEYRKKGFRRRF